MRLGCTSHFEHADPSHDGSEIVNGMLDRVRAEFLRRTDLEDLLRPIPVMCAFRREKRGKT